MSVYRVNVTSLAKSGSAKIVGDATLSQGTNVTLTQSGNDISIAASAGSSFTWTEVTGTSQSAAVNSGYVASNASLVTVTLPSTAAVGDIVRIVGKGAGGWKLAQNASQQVLWNAGAVNGVNQTTSGTGGSCASSDRYDCLDVICVTANTTWIATSARGSITLV